MLVVLVLVACGVHLVQVRAAEIGGGLKPQSASHVGPCTATNGARNTHSRVTLMEGENYKQKTQLCHPETFLQDDLTGMELKQPSVHGMNN